MSNSATTTHQEPTMYRNAVAPRMMTAPNTPAPRLVAWADASVARAEAAARHEAGTGHETIHTAGEPHYCAALGCSWSSSDDVTFLDTPEAWAERGADRFAGGYIRAPFLDLGDDFTADRARAWLAGWDAANLATPVDLP